MDGSDSEVVIRTARPSDLEPMRVITKEVFEPFSLEAQIARAMGAAGGATWLEIKSQDLRRELRTFPEECFVAEAGGRIVGYATCTVHELACRGTIANLAVAADWQGRGLGRRLLLRCLERFRELGLKQAKIETLAWNEVGRHLYPSVGFREVARQVHYLMPLE